MPDQINIMIWNGKFVEKGKKYIKSKKRSENFIEFKFYARNWLSGERLNSNTEYNARLIQTQLIDFDTFIANRFIGEVYRYCYIASFG